MTEDTAIKKMRHKSWFLLLFVQKICIFVTEATMCLLPYTLVRIPTKSELHKFQGED